MLALLADGMVRGKSDAAHEAGVSGGVIDGLVDEGTLETVVLPPEPVAEKPDPDFAPPAFTADQKAAADSIEQTVAKGGYSVTLIDGVTGSGKTEVYFEAVAETRPPRPADADPDAGDRAHRAVSGPLRRALRRAAGGVAFGTDAAPARAHLEGRRRRRSGGRRRRALGTVSALCGSRPDHRR